MSDITTRTLDLAPAPPEETMTIEEQLAAEEEASQMDKVAEIMAVPEPEPNAVDGGPDLPTSEERVLATFFKPEPVIFIEASLLNGGDLQLPLVLSDAELIYEKLGEALAIARANSES